MVYDDLLALRGRVYEALGIYHQAMGAYWDAISQAFPPERVAPIADLVRATGSQLDQALTALLAYLRQLEPSADNDQQMQRASRLLELLDHELDLLE